MSKIDPNKLLISSDFFSVQGEGKSSGVPSFFIRLGLCNLTCGFSNRFLKKLITEKTLADGELFIGDLEEQKLATWTCDSTSQWAWRGEDKEFQYIIDRFIEEGIYEDILDGIVHIIWTGGEPAMVKHQESIVNFINYFAEWEYNRVTGNEEYDNKPCTPFNEIETNGTVYIKEDLFGWLSQINCSPKLSNSGMTEKQRIVPEAIKRIMEHHNYQFKFVISNEEDIKELFCDFVTPFNIPLKNVVCMPALVDRENFHERTQFVLEMAKKYRFTGLTRLHISAYDKTLNV